MPLSPSSILIVSLGLLLFSAVALNDVLAETRSPQLRMRRRMHNEAVQLFDKRVNGKIGPSMNTPAGIPIYQAYVAPEAKYVNEDPKAYVVAQRNPTWEKKCGEKLDGVQAAYGYMVASYNSSTGNHVYKVDVSCVQTSDDTTSKRKFSIVEDFTKDMISDLSWTLTNAQAQAAKLPGGGDPNNKPGGGGSNNKPGGGGGSNNKPGGGGGGNNKPKNSGGGGGVGHHR